MLKLKLLLWHRYSVANLSADGLLLSAGIVNKSLYGGKYAAAIFFRGYNDIFLFFVC